MYNHSQMLNFVCLTSSPTINGTNSLLLCLLLLIHIRLTVYILKIDHQLNQSEFDSWNYFHHLFLISLDFMDLLDFLGFATILKWITNDLLGLFVVEILYPSLTSLFTNQAIAFFRDICSCSKQLFSIFFNSSKVDKKPPIGARHLTYAMKTTNSMLLL